MTSRETSKIDRPRVLDLFSGIGGFSLGLERAGMSTVAFCEIQGYPCRVLRRHWPGVPIFEDVRTLTKTRLGHHGIEVDVICGGFPCQNISNQNVRTRTGIEGAKSGLWSEYARLIRELRPRHAILENVSALRYRGLDKVLGDLAAIGYDAEWHCIGAAHIGAPHARDRLWVVAYPHGGSQGFRPWAAAADVAQPRDVGPALPEKPGQQGGKVRGSRPARGENPDAHHPAFGGTWPLEPDLPRVVDGVPHRLDRCRALGNAVVPQIAELIGRAIMARS